MKIRFLEEGDKDGVCKLSFQINAIHHKYEPGYFNEPPAEGTDWDFWVGCAQKPNSFVLVCISKRKVVGFLSAEIFPAPNLPFVRQMTKCRIGTVVVASDQQRKGIGTALFNRASEIAKARGAEEVGLEVVSFNNGAREFYLKLGFRSLAERMTFELI